MPNIVFGETFADAWHSQLVTLIENGAESSPRGMKIREKVGSVIFVENPLHNILVNDARNLNYRFMVAEWLWIALGRSEVEVIARYNSVMRNFSDDGVSLYGAYGPQIFRQLHYIRNNILNDRDSRQAVMTLWQPNPQPSKDIPCTVAFQFLIRGNRLHTIVTMRSSDIWLGLPYDFFTFSMIANSFAWDWKVSLGSFQLQLGSSHLYERDFDSAFHAATHKSWSLQSPVIPGWPPLYMNEFLVRPETSKSQIPEFIRGVDGPDVWECYIDILRAPNRKAAFNVLTSITG